VLYFISIWRYAASGGAAFSQGGTGARQIAKDATAIVPAFSMPSREIAIIVAMALNYRAGAAAINQDANQISVFIRTSPMCAKLRVIPHLAPHSKCASISEPAPLN